MNSRVIKPRVPARLVATIIAVSLLVIGFIAYSVYYLGRSLQDARMTGIIVAREFLPRQENEITLGRDGNVRSRALEGEYILTVRVVDAKGIPNEYNVWVGKGLYEATKMGQSFDVGPYLVRE